MKGATRKLQFEIINLGLDGGMIRYLVKSSIKISTHTALDVVLDRFAPESEVSDDEYCYLANNAEMTPPVRISSNKRYRWAVTVRLPVVMRESAA